MARRYLTGCPNAEITIYPDNVCPDHALACLDYLRFRWELLKFELITPLIKIQLLEHTHPQ